MSDVLTLPPSDARDGAGGATIDPVDAEIARHQILAIVEEMAATMRKASGSPAITEANDFSVCILNRNGQVSSFALYITLHLGAARECVARLLERYPVDQIRPGDRFIVNDAFIGSAHLNDTGVIAPIFDGSEIVAWTWAEAHLPDYGGWGFGGFAPGITDVYQEGLRLGLVKFVDQGRPVPQVEDIIRNNVRLPDLLMNDVRGLLAACNVCDDRLGQFVAKHGGDYLESVFEWSIAGTETVLRERIARMPNGSYSSEAWIEHDGIGDGYHRVALTMEVLDDTLRFDFIGTDPQVAGFVNGGPGAVWGFLLTPLMHQLAWDLPINHGLINPLEVILPPGTLVSPRPPAGVSGGHLDTGMHTVQPCVSHVLSLALDASGDEELRSRACGLFHHTWMTENWFGQDHSGNPFLFFNLDGGGTGGGAQTVCDGLHVAGDLCQPDNHIPDVEWYEYLNPLVFLFRTTWQDSGGPGRYRGGVAVEEAWCLRGASRASGTIFGQGAEIPRQGLFGGMPSGGHMYEIWRGVRALDRLAGGGCVADRTQLLATAQQASGSCFQPPFKVSNLQLADADVVYRTKGGGSGLGDPLSRDPQLVRQDVVRGLVSRSAAERAYGVCLTEDAAVDGEATERRRGEIRARRASGERLGSAAPGAGALSRSIVRCTTCEALVAKPDWRGDVLARRIPATDYLAEVGGWVLAPRAGDVNVVEYACPDCGSLLDVVVEVHRTAGRV